MTTPDPRTDLAGYLDLTDDQAAWCHKAPVGTVAAAVGARLIEQDQARADEPDDGLIPVTVRLTAEEVRATAAIHPNSFPRLDGHGVSAWKLNAACRAIDLPAPKPPWKSPLADLPDLTEEQCRDAVLAADGYPDSDRPWPQIGRALIAAGWTPEGEA